MKKNDKRMLMIAATPLYMEKGSSLRVAHVLQALSSKYDIDVATYSIGSNIELSNVNIFRTYKNFKPRLKVSEPTVAKLIMDFLLLLLCIKLVLSNRYEIIHCEDFEAAFLGSILSFFMRKPKLVYDVHNRVIENFFRINKKYYLMNLFLFCERLILRRVDFLLVNWKSCAIDPVLTNIKHFQFYDKIDLSIEEFSFEKNRYFIYSGNCELYQGLREFLNVFAQTDLEAKLAVVGECNDDLIRYVRERKLQNRIVFTGKLGVPKTNYLISKSLFGILPRVLGKMPSMKVIHYLVWEKPVLANLIECNRELLEDRYNCLFYSGNDDLKNKLELMANNMELRDKLTDGAKETKRLILDNWNKTAFLSKYEDAVTKADRR